MKNILDSLTKEEKGRLKIVHLNKGEILFSEGEVCKNIGIVFVGELKIASYLEDGHEIVYNVIKKGMMFGNNLIFSSEPVYRGDVIANENSYLYILSKDQLLNLLKTNDDFLIAFLNAQSEFGKGLNLSIKLLTFNNAQERILYYLQINKDIVTYKSITELAKTLYLSREVLSRTLHKMERDQIIRLEDKKIIKI